MKISPNLIRVCNIVCAVLMIALLVLQLLPYWTFPECICTEACASNFDFNSDCQMCRAYYKVCTQIPQDALTANVERLDYSKPWQVSIQQYTWMPTFDNCDGATEWFQKYFQDLYNDFDFEFQVKDVVLMPVLVLAGTVFGAYFCLTKSKKALCGILPLIVGVAGVVGYLTIPVYNTTNVVGGMWIIHLVISAVVLLGSLLPVAECLFRAIDWCNPKKAQ